MANFAYFVKIKINSNFFNLLLTTRNSCAIIDIVMNIKTINIPLLPNLTIDKKRELPTISGIYFVFSQSELLYIGRTTNLQSRWLGHHRLSDFKSKKEVRIYWLEVLEVEILRNLEKQAIKFFKPCLNSQREKGEMDAIFQCRIPKKLLKQAKAKSQRTGITLAFVARQALEELIKQS